MTRIIFPINFFFIFNLRFLFIFVFISPLYYEISQIKIIQYLIKYIIFIKHWFFLKKINKWIVEIVFARLYYDKLYWQMMSNLYSFFNSLVFGEEDPHLIIKYIYKSQTCGLPFIVLILKAK